MPTITRELREHLKTIEWAGYGQTCPSCKRPKAPHVQLTHGHAPDCWLAAALATPDTLPPPEPPADIKCEHCGFRTPAPYRPLWQRGQD